MFRDTTLPKLVAEKLKSIYNTQRPIWLSAGCQQRYLQILILLCHCERHVLTPSCAHSVITTSPHKHVPPLPLPPCLSAGRTYLRLCVCLGLMSNTCRIVSRLFRWTFKGVTYKGHPMLQWIINIYLYVFSTQTNPAYVQRRSAPVWIVFRLSVYDRTDQCPLMGRRRELQPGVLQEATKSL